MLDGSVVNPGDRVFDILHGTGEVTSVTPEGGFNVRFASNGAVQPFLPNGYKAGGVKRIYWRNPIILVPNKENIREEELIKLLTKTVTDFTNSIGGEL